MHHLDLETQHRTASLKKREKRNDRAGDGLPLTVRIPRPLSQGNMLFSAPLCVHNRCSRVNY